MALPTAPQPRTPRDTSRWHPTPVTPPPTPHPAELSGEPWRPVAGWGRAGRERAQVGVESDRSGRSAGDFDEGVIIRPEDQVETGGCACGCGGPACWDPDTYISERRPSEALAAHRAAVTAMVAAAGGVGAHAVGAAATGEDEAGDELRLVAWFDVRLDWLARRQLESDLEDLLDVGVTITPVTPTEP